MRFSAPQEPRPAPEDKLEESDVQLIIVETRPASIFDEVPKWKPAAFLCFGTKDYGEDATARRRARGGAAEQHGAAAQTRFSFG